MSLTGIETPLDCRHPKGDLDKGSIEDGEKQTARQRSSLINVSGHEQELDRQFGLLSIISAGIVTGNTWTALGGAIVKTNPMSISCRVVSLTRRTRWLLCTTGVLQGLYMNCEQHRLVEMSFNSSLLQHHGVDLLLVCRGLDRRTRFGYPCLWRRFVHSPPPGPYIF